MSVLAVNANSNVTAVVVESTVTFKCHVCNSTKVLWDFTEPLYVNDELVTKFAKRHSVKHLNGTVELTIKNVQHCDAGLYRCSFLNDSGLSECHFLLITIGK